MRLNICKGDENMPSETFYKLNEEKRKKIITAMKKEFSKTTFDEASINKIVQDAGISKGSFFQYFESKEEAINYLITLKMEKEVELFKETLKNNEGNLERVFLHLFNVMKEGQCEEERCLMANIFKNLMSDKHKFMKLHKERMKESSLKNELIETYKGIDKSIYQIETEQQYLIVINMLVNVLRSNLMEVFTKKSSINQAEEQFKYELNIIMKGIGKS